MFLNRLCRAVLKFDWASENMPINVSYMGTKRQIASTVAQIISYGSKGPLLDLFSGVCAVGSAVGQERQIWCNDIQKFASTVATAFFVSKDSPISAISSAGLVYPLYSSNKKTLTKIYYDNLTEEEKFLLSKSAEKIALYIDNLPYIGASTSLEKKRQKLAKYPKKFPYQLFSITFAGGYFSLSQAVQIDSLRYAMDFLLDTGKISKDQHRWMLLALCQAVSKVSTTTGHFAQHLKIKSSNCFRFLAQRKRNVWHEWLSALDSFCPIGGKRWRYGNKVFQNDAVELLKILRKKKQVPAVVYADPPYTSDQYSRYYHLYETLLLYDYPPAYGTGRYRPDRFCSPFSMKRKVRSAVEALSQECAKLGSEFVLSYPDNGLLPESRNTVLSILRKNFKKCEVVEVIKHQHSSLGASKGAQKYHVNEVIFGAR